MEDLDNMLMLPNNGEHFDSQSWPDDRANCGIVVPSCQSKLVPRWDRLMSGKCHLVGLLHGCDGLVQGCPVNAGVEMDHMVGCVEEIVIDRIISQSRQ